jgi:hypothetical protein
LTYQGEEKKSMADEVFIIAVVEITPHVAVRKKNDVVRGSKQMCWDIQLGFR